MLPPQWESPMDKATTNLLVLLRDALSVADQAGEHMIALRSCFH